MKASSVRYTLLPGGPQFVSTSITPPESSVTRAQRRAPVSPGTTGKADGPGGGVVNGFGVMATGAMKVTPGSGGGAEVSR